MSTIIALYSWKNICRQQFVRTFHCGGVVYFKPQCTIEKRAKMLMKLIQNKDKQNTWPLQVGSQGAPDQKIYDKIHKPHRRASVVNTLFMENITDVISTGDVCPEIMGCGVEITGVRVTSDYQIVNVFWQLSNVDDIPNTNVEMMLAKGAPAMRRELIRRNVLGKVPRIHFIRDPTNKRAADFQKCLEASGVSKLKDPPSVPAADLMKDIFKFTESRDQFLKKNSVNVEEKPKTPSVHPEVTPENPQDMRSDIMGLDHKKILSKVLKSKKISKNVPMVSSSEIECTAKEQDDGELENCDAVHSIPAVPLFSNIDRRKQIKQFCVDRNIQRAKIKKRSEEASACNTAAIDYLNDIIDDSFEDDYLEEDYQDTDEWHV